MENLLHFGRLQDISRNDLKTNIKNLLSITKLDGHQDKLADHLSGGMQKRLDISCSLIHKPKVLILDEPTADLDPILQEEILHLLEQVNKHGVTIIIASHHLEGIEKICNKVAIVHNGKVHSHGKMDDIRKPYLKDHFTINVHPGEEKERVIARIRDLPVHKIVDQGSKLVIYPDDVEKTINHLITIIQDEKFHLMDMNLRKPSLHDIFRKIAQEK
jgi:ABC-2 type transport system ATP-binding protein